MFYKWCLQFFELLNLYLSCISFLHYFPFYKLIGKCLELFYTHLYSLQLNHICQLKTFFLFHAFYCFKLYPQRYFMIKDCIV